MPRPVCFEKYYSSLLCSFTFIVLKSSPLKCQALGQQTTFENIFFYLENKLTFHVNHLPKDDSNEISVLISLTNN